MFQLNYTLEEAFWDESAWYWLIYYKHILQAG